MPGSDTGSSTIHQEEFLGVTTKRKDEDISKSQADESIDCMLLEQRSSKEEDSKNDIETGTAIASLPPGLSAADFPDGGLEAVSCCSEPRYCSWQLFSSMASFSHGVLPQIILFRWL